MSDIEIHHLGAAYALDALDERERLAFETHYTSCDICRTDVREYRAAAAELASLTADPPPAGLRASVLAEIAKTRQLSPLHDGVTHLADRRRRRLTTAALAIAAAVACFVVGAVVVGGRDRGGFDGEVASMLEQPDVQFARLAGDAVGSVRVVWTDDQVALIGDGLATPDEGTGYELWLIDSEGPRPMRILDGADDGEVRRVAPIDGEPVAWGITIEPQSGSDAPTLPIIYVAEVATPE